MQDDSWMFVLQGIFRMICFRWDDAFGGAVWDERGFGWIC